MNDEAVSGRLAMVHGDDVEVGYFSATGAIAQ
jgi:hypothetical protein